MLGRHIKIGHAGTLDPFASGLLIVAIGKAATRSINTLVDCDKTYWVKAKLGELTDTLDHTGTIIEHTPTAQLRIEQLKEAITKIGTSYEQTPPIYSALWHEGTRLYLLARTATLTKEELDTIAAKKKRTVHIRHIELESYEHPFFTFTATVSKGTYIRSLAHDIAQRLGTCATTYTLVRTAIGPYSLADAHTLEEIITQQVSLGSIVKEIP